MNREDMAIDLSPHMNTMYKYTLMWVEKQTVKIPRAGRIRKVALQNGEVCLWAEVNSGNELREREVWIYPTGANMNKCYGVYLDTIFLDSGLVFHVFVSQT